VKRSLVFLSILVVGLLVGFTGAEAAVEGFAPSVDRNLTPGTETGRPYLVRPTRAFPLGEPTPVALPMPVQPDDQMGQRSVSSDSKLGPRDTGSVGARVSVGSALLTPRGGTMSTPEQQADRAIDRLIRRLN
jgi:hypothetical protein